jgi:hypothetical protein
MLYPAPELPDDTYWNAPLERGSTGNVRPPGRHDQKRTELTPGTVLVREWDRQSQRVMGWPTAALR